MGDFLAKTPLLRFFIPLLIGIIFSYIYTSLTIPICCIVIGILLIIFYNIIKSYNYKGYTHSCAIFLIMIGIGWGNSILLSTESTQILPPQRNLTCTARIENIIDKESSMRVELKCMEFYDSIGNKVFGNKVFGNNINLLGYIEGNDYSLHEGDILFLKFDPHPITSLGNPDEFNYANYMKYHGFAYQQFIQKGQYRYIGKSKSIFILARQCQRYLINRVLSSNLSLQAQQFIITSILGDKSFMDEKTKENFANIGIAHTLALSGLHVGIIILILSILLYPLDYFMLRNYRLTIIMVMLIVYGFITGLSPSVIRAIIMAIFLFTSIIFRRNYSNTNSLIGAAILILLIEPNQMFQIGFQMSVIAVASIIAFYHIFNQVSPKHRISYYIMGNISITLSAMIGTGILAIYYFHVFPTLFLFSNFIIIPILPIIFIIGILFIIFPSSFVAGLFDIIYSPLNWIVGTFGSRELSIFDNLYISSPELVLYTLTVILILFWIRNRSMKPLYLLFGTLILLAIAYPISHSDNYNEGIVIYNDFKSTPILYYCDNKAYIFNTDSVGAENIRKHNKTFFAKNNLSLCHSINENSIIAQKCMQQDMFLYICGRKIAVIDENYKNYLKYRKSPIKVDLMVITETYYGNLERIFSLIETDIVILSGGIYHKRLNSYINECTTLNIPYYSIQNNGAFQLYK